MDQSTYSAIVVPSLLKKTPEQLRLTITRGQNHQDWNLRNSWKRLNARLNCERSTIRTRATPEPHEMTPKKAEFANYAGTGLKCAFCLGEHKHEDCVKAKNVSERKQILLKYGRCCNCIKRGHLFRECKSIVTCKFCNGKHHSSLCRSDSKGGRSV